jgi:DeoR family transcriptional regulator, suf operon transcriptional repressor
VEGPRPHILRFLQKCGRASVDQLAREIGLASATIRRHLDVLQRDQLIAYDQVKKKTGRPEYVYYLTEHGQEVQPKGYDRLLSGVLLELGTLSHDEATTHSGPELLQTMLQRVALQTVGGHPRDSAEDSFSGRLSRVKEIVEQEGFSPEIEQVDGSARIWLRNCPFRRVSMTNPAVCTYDKALLSMILGSEPVLESTIRDGGHWCSYLTSDPEHHPQAN